SAHADDLAAKLANEPSVDAPDIPGPDDCCAHGSPHSCLVGLPGGEAAEERLATAGFFYQDLSLVPLMSVARNFFLGREIRIVSRFSIAAARLAPMRNRRSTASSFWA